MAFVIQITQIQMLRMLGIFLEGKFLTLLNILNVKSLRNLRIFPYRKFLKFLKILIGLGPWLTLGY